MSWKIGEYFAPEMIGSSQDSISDTLEGTAYSVTTGKYTVKLTDEEVDDKSKELVDKIQESNDLEEEKKEVMKDYKEKLSSLKGETNTLCHAIKYRAEEKEGKLFNIDDPETGNMYTFDQNGMCVVTRKLKASERQRSIMTIEKNSKTA